MPKVNPRQSVLAEVDLKSLDAFILLLYSAAAAVAKDETTPALAQKASAWSRDAADVDASLGTDIVSTLVRIIKTGKYDEDDLITQVRELRKGIRKEVTTDTDVDHDHLDMLLSLTAYLSSRSEGALRKLVSLAPKTDSKDIIDALAFKPNSQKEYVKPLEKIVGLFKRKGTTLTAEEQKKLKKKSPQAHKEYLRLRKEFNNVWKDELRNLINEAGRPMTDFQYALDYLKSQGIQNPLPTTFEGNIDANGKLYTSTGKLINNVPGTGFKIVMNPEYDAKKDNGYVFTTVNSEGKISQYVYTLDYRQAATKEKFKKVELLSNVIDSIRSKWMKYVKVGGNTPKAVSSTILELLYQFSARVGSMGNATGGQSTYGMSTILRKHVKVSSNGMIIMYPAKDAVKKTCVLQASSIEAKWLIRNVQQCLKDKQPADRVFTFEHNRKFYPITGNIVNKWFTSLGAPEGVTIHKIRHVRGTKLFAQELENNADKINNTKKPLTQADADALFKAMATKVGSLLGHVSGVGKTQKVQPMTAVQNYIDPSLMVGYYQRLGLRAPKFLSKIKSN